MGRYASYEEVVARYKTLEHEGEFLVDSSHLLFAENEIDSRLGQHFTLPFSNNNLTVKDLAIDLCALRALPNLRKEERDALQSRVDGIFDDLIAGRRALVLSDGETQLKSVGETVYSSTGEYTPIFGFSDVEESVVDDDLLDDEEDARE